MGLSAVCFYYISISFDSFFSPFCHLIQMYFQLSWVHSFSVPVCSSAVPVGFHPFLSSQTGSGSGSTVLSSLFVVFVILFSPSVIFMDIAVLFAFLYICSRVFYFVTLCFFLTFPSCWYIFYFPPLFSLFSACLEDVFRAFNKSVSTFSLAFCFSISVRS